jgi:hypothetical protein
MPKRLAPQKAQKSLLLFSGIKQIAAICIADAIFVAGLEAEEFGHFENLLHEHLALAS